MTKELSAYFWVQNGGDTFWAYDDYNPELVPFVEGWCKHGDQQRIQQILRQESTSITPEIALDVLTSELAYRPITIEQSAILLEKQILDHVRTYQEQEEGKITEYSVDMHHDHYDSPTLLLKQYRHGPGLALEFPSVALPRPAEDILLRKDSEDATLFFQLTPVHVMIDLVTESQSTVLGASLPQRVLGTGVVNTLVAKMGYRYA